MSPRERQGQRFSIMAESPRGTTGAMVLETGKEELYRRGAMLQYLLWTMQQIS